MIPKWDKRFLEMAELVATWSKDPSTKVGAVIVDGKNRVVGTGYNGPPRGVVDEDLSEDRERRLMRTIHAEVNAILFSNKSDLSDATIYVTAPPCANCATLIIQKGIRHVVCKQADDAFIRRWYGHLKEVEAMFTNVGGSMTIYEHNS